MTIEYGRAKKLKADCKKCIHWYGKCSYSMEIDKKGYCKYYFFKSKMKNKKSKR